MHFLLGNSDTLDPTYMYLVAGVIVVIVVLVFVVLMKRPWTYFRVKHKDTELEIGNKPGDAGEVAKRILDQAERNQSLQEQVSELKSENERLKQQQLVTEAVQRVEAEADKGDDQARAAIEEARASGDTEKLQAALISVSDRQADKIKADLTDHIQLCREIAEIAFLRGDIDEAMRRLEVILKADPDDLDATNRLGHIYKLRGELDKAEQAYLRIGELSANDLEGQSISHGNLGSIYIMRGQLDLAEQSISKALAISKELDLNEGVANSYGTLGRIYFENGDYDLAK